MNREVNSQEVEDGVFGALPLSYKGIVSDVMNEMNA
mgnify:CR=1 FL=1